MVRHKSKTGPRLKPRTMADTGDEGQSQVNPYLALREAKIARNEERLRSLGLGSKNKPPAAAKRVQHTTTKVIRKEEPAVLRRSRRLSQDPERPSLEEPAVHTVVSQKRKRPRTTSFPKSENSDKPKSAAALRPPPAENSVRSITIDPKTLVLGNETDDNSGVLGLPMDQTGKEFVVYESFERAAAEEDKLRLEGSRLSFNKYSGVQEWKNIMFLWVNLGGKDGTVFNDFLEQGRQITWFGGSRMHDDTPVVQKLLTLGHQASSTSSNLILWCRRYEKEQKKFGPYVCLGRLAYHSHVPGSHPLAFVWNLLDFEALRNHSDEFVQQRFQQFLDT